ncbi:pyridoxamine 5'-phosphate oxidase family protein [Nocardioides sp.]|jgi:nitroimidazol reductase NimA-like FMN-containing flavoprotein (pyridoxamine 5'-phosphate oxidase superfamily)|uniref:pyridoxamine 5'-phosphate oxidase family protein n=1 Tax=Nocardioides sp. TaxID=35761 RepID=UPI0031FEF819|nr:Pyridoxamine 5-phosphate oxidase [Nocardioides sp.]
MSSFLDTGGQLIELTRDECWEQLSSCEVGRVAWCGSGGPTVLPVNFVAAEGKIVFRTSPYSASARECDDLPVAFQVDGIDPVTRSGWSVLARGTAHLLYDGARAPSVGAAVDVWAGGRRALHVVIEPRKLTGRRLLPS